MRLSPPDRGIDIWHRPSQRAFQCKSHQQGAFGAIDGKESVVSLKTAYEHKSSFDWNLYCFATNANYTGAAFENILNEAITLGLSKDQIEHRGPEYWNQLCEKYQGNISHRFDYRMSVTTDQVIEAFQKAGYYDKYVKDFKEKIQSGEFSLIITNNRTPVEIEVPFSPDLSIENYLDVAKELLGISLEWTNFANLETSAGPSLTITIDRKAQTFSTKIGDLPIKSGDKLQLWITIVWRDSLKKDCKEHVLLATHRMYHLSTDIFTKIERPSEVVNRKDITIDSEEKIIQAMIWQGVHSLL